MDENGGVVEITAGCGCGWFAHATCRAEAEADCIGDIRREFAEHVTKPLRPAPMTRGGEIRGLKFTSIAIDESPLAICGIVEHFLRREGIAVREDDTR